MSTTANENRSKNFEGIITFDTDPIPNKTNTDEKKNRSLEEEIGISLDDIEISANLAFRIARDALPENVKIGKDPKLALGKSATVFLSYLGAIAQELAAEKKHKLVSVNDVYNALNLLEFSEFIDPIKEYLEVSKEAAKNKKINTGDVETEKSTLEETNTMQD